MMMFNVVHVTTETAPTTLGRPVKKMDVHHFYNPPGDNVLDRFFRRYKNISVFIDINGIASCVNNSDMVLLSWQPAVGRSRGRNMTV